LRGVRRMRTRLVTRWVLFLSAVVLAALACDASSEVQPTLAIPPTVAPIDLRPVEKISAGDQRTIIAQDAFDTSFDGWTFFAEEPTVGEARHEGGALVAEIELVPESVAVLFRDVSHLTAPVDGYSLTLSVQGRPFYLFLAASEADGSNYQLLLPVYPQDGEQEVHAPLAWFILSDASQDENGQLDPAQLNQVGLLDASSFLGVFGLGTLRLEGVTYWTGSPEIAFRCGGDGEMREPLSVGVDAGFLPRGEEEHSQWTVNGSPIGPLSLFTAQGVNALRLRIWVGEKGESHAEYALELGRRALDQGWDVYAVLFLSPDWADVNKQPAPPEWEDLLLQERTDAIRIYAEDITRRLLDAGIDPLYYAIGNEIDYGISGVFAAIEERSANVLRRDIWPAEAELIKAGIDGVRAVDPEAKIMLHIALSFDPFFSEAFFAAMRDLEVPFDLIGLSYYPSAMGPLSAMRFCQTLERLKTTIDLPVVIAEFAYPAEVPTGGPFGGWQYEVPGYPHTPRGQAEWLADFLTDMRIRADVVGAYYFSPTFYWSGELWGPFALFDAEGEARPALGAFSAGVSPVEP
ncbi:MAG: arabinogalactan endo-1,4-beta-galactosidase, partial [Anaerolineales bacterium]|nr:arabinogalactan endo-1,4-beta-galactosidase [Anaerolineales bacterium]